MSDTQNPDRQAIEAMNGWSAGILQEDYGDSAWVEKMGLCVVTRDYMPQHEQRIWRWLRRVAEFIDTMEEEATRHDHANR